MLDAAVASTMRDEAVRRTLRRLLAEQNQDLLALSRDYSVDQIREAMLLLIASRTTGDLSEWTRLSADQVVNRWQSAWEQRGRFATLVQSSHLGSSLPARSGQNRCFAPQVRTAHSCSTFWDACRSWNRDNALTLCWKRSWALRESTI